MDLWTEAVGMPLDIDALKNRNSISLYGYEYVVSAKRSSIYNVHFKFFPAFSDEAFFRGFAGFDFSTWEFPEELI